jgi:hypothetical protein
MTTTSRSDIFQQAEVRFHWSPTLKTGAYEPCSAGLYAFKDALDFLGKLKNRPGTTIDRQRGGLQDLDDPCGKRLQVRDPQECLRELSVRLVEPLTRFGTDAEDGPKEFGVAVERTRLAAAKQPQHLRCRAEAAQRSSRRNRSREEYAS